MAAMTGACAVGLNGEGGVGGERAGEIEVGEGEVAGVLDEDVLGLEITVDDAEGVKMVESAEDLCQIEADDGGGEGAIALALAEMVEVAAGAIRGGPRQEAVVLKGT